MWLRWLPWRYIVRRIARARGFIDPIMVLSRLHSFAQPSEVAAPFELLRAGVVFHARGLMNTAVIQHNLDWIWPYWVERQFDPLDESFIPRAFSITHVNLTHRNWTAVGWPDCDRFPLIDPRGLLTPFWDGWSIDCWLATDEEILAPARLSQVDQQLELADPAQLIVRTIAETTDLRLEMRAKVVIEDGVPVCRQEVTAWAARPARLVIAVRPYNPEGVSFIHRIDQRTDRSGWRIDDERDVALSPNPDRLLLSIYKQGDVASQLNAAEAATDCVCDVGLATAAAIYPIAPATSRDVEINISLADDHTEAQQQSRAGRYCGWQAAMQDHCQLRIPDVQVQFLYDAALRTIVLHSPLDVYPGPYTYKRFWFRDAAFILDALLQMGLHHRVRRVLDRFPLRQTRAGYFLSQEGEWDSNGEALWIMERYCRLTGKSPSADWFDSIRRGARWIMHKRLADRIDAPHAGLLPAGFSAEHLGPNDFYYWDDYWSVAGLRSASQMLRQGSDTKLADHCESEANALSGAIERALQLTADQRPRGGIPASPYRRLDAGAIGSLVASYPLQLVSPNDQRLNDTVEFLLQHCFVNGGFFQDMIHSGINPYLTLHVAQALLRRDDPRVADLMYAVAQLASPTGQWPEAIHPRTMGGCMGDGQHVWAAAEWLLLLRNCFVREEVGSSGLIVGSGLPAAWLAAAGPILRLGPTPTAYGPTTIEIEVQPNQAIVACSGDWRGAPPHLEIRLPGFSRMTTPFQPALVVPRQR